MYHNCQNIILAAIQTHNLLVKVLFKKITWRGKSVQDKEK